MLLATKNCKLGVAFFTQKRLQGELSAKISTQHRAWGHITRWGKHFIFHFDLLHKEPAIKSTLPLSVSTADVRKTPLRLNMSHSNLLRSPVCIKTMCQSDGFKKEIHWCRMCRNDSPSSIIHRNKVWTVLTTFTRVIDTSRINDNRSRWENQRTLVYWTLAMSVGWKVHQLALNIQFNCGCFCAKVKFFQKYEVHKSRSGVVGQNDPGYQKNLITSNNRLRKINIQEIYEREKKQCLWSFSCLTYIQ